MKGKKNNKKPQKSSETDPSVSRPNPSPYEESETTENEFSEIDTKASPEIRKRGGNAANQKIKQSIENKKIDEIPQPSNGIARNAPIEVKASNLKVRTIWTIVMLLAFIAIIAAGHIYCAILIFFMNLGMVKEIMSLKRNRERESEVSFSMKLNWYFFAVAVFYFYGKLFTSVLAHVTLTNPIIAIVVKYHDFISFALWVTGFLMFTLSLKKGYYRYQFRQFGWVHIAVMLIVGQGAAIINNIYEGIIWFILPALLVISNDIFAYLFGIWLGKTRLIELSPKKTLEGFIGGMISTFVFSLIFSSIFSRFDYLVCRQHQLQFLPFQWGTCERPIVFQYFEQSLPSFLGNIHIPFLGIVNHHFKMSEMQIHALILSLFTSLVSPFGGFFASGFKRAIKVKDFAAIIPGHGGITDRMDCQVLTGTFVYVYVHQIVNGRINFIHGVTRFIMNEMDPTQQLLVFKELQSFLLGRGLLNSTLAVEA